MDSKNKIVKKTFSHMIEVGTSKNFSVEKNASLKPDKAEQADTHIASAGRHFIVDFWGAQHLEDLKVIEDALTQATAVAGATLLHIHLHSFNEGGGVTGVALLAESHISIHTWPELDYAALDLFMCGNAKPEKAVELLINVFKPLKSEVKELLRGRIDSKSEVKV